MKILVTGGLGFLGSYLVDELVDVYPEARIHIVDNLSSNVLDLQHPWGPNVFVSPTSIARFLPPYNFDQIYHLASVVGPAGILPYAGDIIRSVVSDTYSVMDMASQMGAPMLDVSTSEVYGGGQNGLCSEIMDKVVPARTSVRAEYAIAKLAAEAAIVNTVARGGLKATIVRPFNIVGPRQSPKGGFVLPRFVDQALAGEPLTIFGDGTQVRAFTDARDVAHGLRLALESGRPGEIYNVGNPGNKVTIQELAELVIMLTNSASDVIYVDPKAIWGASYEEASDKYPDPRKTAEELGWTPLRTLRSIVADTVIQRRLP